MEHVRTTYWIGRMAWHSHLTPVCNCSVKIAREKGSQDATFFQTGIDPTGEGNPGVELTQHLPNIA